MEAFRGIYVKLTWDIWESCLGLSKAFPGIYANLAWDIDKSGLGLRKSLPYWVEKLA
jgi:hypothetical protein